VIIVYLSMQGEPLSLLIAIAATVILGAAPYFFVEYPTRGISRNRHRAWLMASVAVALSVVAVPSAMIYLKDGGPGRLDPQIEAVFNAANERNPRMKECHVDRGINVPQCQYGGETLGAIVIGDSHGASVVRSVELALPSKDLHVLDWTMGSCQTVLGLKKAGNVGFRCGEFVEKALEMSINIDSPVPLIIMNRLSSLMLGKNEEDDAIPDKYITTPYPSRTPEFIAEIQSALASTVCKFTEDRMVYIVEPIPELIQNVPKTMGRHMQAGRDSRVSISLEEHLLRSKIALETIDLAVEQCGAIPLDPLPYLCSDGRC